ncbi:condensin-2 complex subunit D3 isoform X2 [Hyperolius riggenbachi]
MQRVLSLHAASLYFLLLEIPGSVASQMFHPILFEKAMNTLEKCWPQDADSTRKRKKDAPKSSQGEHRGARKRARPVRREEELLEGSLEEEEDEIYFSNRDYMNIRDAIVMLLKSLLRLLPKFSLKDREQSLLHCVQVLINLTSFEATPHELTLSDSGSPDHLRYVPELAYHGLWLLCQPNHGDVGKILRSLFHRLLNVILMVKGGVGSNPSLLAISAPVTSARDQTIRFVSFIVDKMQEAALPVLWILLQHICAKCPDKTDYRLSAAQALVKLQDKLPDAKYASFIHWLYKWSRNAKSSYRMFAVEAAVALLDLPERSVDDSFPQEEVRFLQHKFMIQEIVFSRCSDKVPTIRSKALSCLAQLLEKQGALVGVQEILQGSSCRTVSASSTTESSVNGTEASSHTRKTINVMRTIEVTEASAAKGVDGQEMLETLRLRAADGKTTVRKSALQVLMSILKYSLVPCSAEELAILRDRCRDPALSVRKQSLVSLTELLQAQPQNVMVQKAWLNGMIPVVMDTESTVQEKMLERLDEVLLQNIKHYKYYTDYEEKQKLTWDLLQLLSTECQDLSRYLTKVCSLWGKQDKFSATLFKNLISHTGTEHDTPAWMLLAKVTIFAPKLDYTKILSTWEEVSRQNDTCFSPATSHIMYVIGHIAKHLTADSRTQLIDQMKLWLKEFKSSLEVISPAIEALQKLCYAQHETVESAQDLLNNVFGDLVSVCENHIASIVMSDSQEEFDVDLLVRHIFTLGCAALRCPARVEKRVLLLIQGLLASLPTEQDSVASENQDIIQSQPSSQPASQPSSQPASQPLSQFRGSKMPPLVRAHAFITLGKLCLQHEDLAKKCLPALIRELEISDDVAIRNNVMIVICDLCVRYTTMVDRYIPSVSVCLRDRESLIRKQTLIMLTNLLQEEFIKWKGSLFFRFVIVMVDPDPDIVELAEFCLVNLLLKRNPVMFSQHFIECIFHFNRYEKHERYNQFPQTEREKKSFSLKGAENKQKRMKIYKFLLEHFTDEQRFNLITKISQNVLACFVDGLLPVDMAANDLLVDVFEIMSCKEIKLSAMRSKPGEEDGGEEDDEMAMANAVHKVAQKKLLSQVQKKNLIENLIPIISSLKELLEKQKIPATRELMSCLREMMQDYRDEIKDVFAANKQLAAEIEYDMRRYENELEEERMQNELGNAAGRGASIRSPQGSPLVGANRTPDARRSPLATIQEQGRLSAGQPCTPVGTPRIAIMAGQVARPRQMSLTTQAIINSAKKLAEGYEKGRSKSMGAVRSSASPIAENSKMVSFSTSEAAWNGGQEGRAISTPDRTIHNLTFGAGVSYISANQTLSNNSINVSRDKEEELLCVVLPDQPASQPRQWNIESPVQRKTRHSSRTTPKNR